MGVSLIREAPPSDVDVSNWRARVTRSHGARDSWRTSTNPHGLTPSRRPSFPPALRAPDRTPTEHERLRAATKGLQCPGIQRETDTRQAQYDTLVSGASTRLAISGVLSPGAAMKNKPTDDEEIANEDAHHLKHRQAESSSGTGEAVPRSPPSRAAGHLVDQLACFVERAWIQSTAEQLIGLVLTLRHAAQCFNARPQLVEQNSRI